MSKIEDNYSSMGFSQAQFFEYAEDLRRNPIKSADQIEACKLVKLILERRDTVLVQYSLDKEIFSAGKPNFDSQKDQRLQKLAKEARALEAQARTELTKFFQARGYIVSYILCDQKAINAEPFIKKILSNGLSKYGASLAHSEIFPRMRDVFVKGSSW